MKRDELRMAIKIGIEKEMKRIAKLGLKISTDYIYDRHTAPAEDEQSLPEDSYKPATILCEMADKAKGKYIFIRDDFARFLLEELVSGAWHYEGAVEQDPSLRRFLPTADRILARWGHLFEEQRIMGIGGANANHSH